MNVAIHFPKLDIQHLVSSLWKHLSPHCEFCPTKGIYLQEINQLLTCKKVLGVTL